MTTALYVPGTSEQDMSKVIMSAQLVAGQTATNTDAITTANANITALQTSRASASTFGLAEVDGTTITAASGVLSTVNPLPAPIKASLGSDTAISNSVYTDGPSIAQGTSGTWWASGTVTVLDTVGATAYNCKLWDGITIIASGRFTTTGANLSMAIALSGFLATPAANIRMSVTGNAAGATSTFKFNVSGNSKDCTVSAFRIA